MSDILECLPIREEVLFHKCSQAICLGAIFTDRCSMPFMRSSCMVTRYSSRCIRPWILGSSPPLRLMHLQEDPPRGMSMILKLVPTRKSGGLGHKTILLHGKIADPGSEIQSTAISQADWTHGAASLVSGSFGEQCIYQFVLVGSDLPTSCRDVIPVHAFKRFIQACR